MPNIRLMNWNIQNLGPLKYTLSDVMKGIAKVVVDNRIDIFTVLELNTTNPVMAAQIAATLSATLNAYALTKNPPAGPTDWTTYVLSPNTGREFYGFFVRDFAVVKPAPITGPGAAAPATLGGAGGTPVAGAQFTLMGGAGAAASRFPLVDADLTLPNQHRRAHWTGTRLPCLGLFHIPGALPANQYLSIFACHFAANDIQAPSQIRVLPAFGLLNGAASNAPVSLTIGGVARPITQIAVTGDFNIDFPNPDYNPLTNAQAPVAALQFATAINGTKTHLTTFKGKRNPGDVGPVTNPRFTQTGEMAVSCFDNFFVGVNFVLAGAAGAGPGARVLANPEVIDIPALIKTRAIKLDASVNHYAELDQRGFDNPSGKFYKTTVSDFSKQLTDKHMFINYRSALIGARLIDAALATRPFALTAAQLQSPNVSALFGWAFTPAGLVLSDAQRLPDRDGHVVVQGRLAQPFLAIANAQAVAEIGVVDGAARFQLTVSGLPEGWKLSQSFPTLADSLADDFDPQDPQFRLDSSDLDPLPADFQSSLGYPSSSAPLEQSLRKGLRFRARLKPGPASGTLIGLIGESGLLEVDGPIELTADGIPRMLLATALTDKTTPTVLGHLRLPLQFQLVSVLTEFDTEPPDPEDQAPDDTGPRDQRPVLPTVFCRLAATLAFNTGKTVLPIALGVDYFGVDGAPLTFEADLSGASEVLFTAIPALLSDTPVADHVPADVPALDALTLRQFRFTVAPVERRLISVSVGVGLKKSWDLVHEIGLSIQDLEVVFSVVDPLGPGRGVEVGIFGSVSLSGANATIDGYVGLPDLNFTCDLAAGSTPDLTQILHAILPDLGAMPPIVCEAMRLSGNARHSSYSFSTTLSGGSPTGWSIPVGVTKLALSSVSLDVSHDPTAGNQGQMVAAVQVGSASFVAGWLMPGGLTLEGQIPRIDLKELATTLTGGFLDLPSGFPDVVLVNSNVLVTASSQGTGGTSYDFALDTDVTVPGLGDLGTLLFELRKDTAGFGFMAGFLVPQKWSPAQIWSVFGDIFKGLSFSNSGLIVSSLQGAAAPPGNLKALRALPGSIQRGVTFFTSVDLTGPVLGKVGNLFSGLGTLNLVAVIASDPKQTQVIASIGNQPAGKKSVSFDGFSLVLIPGQESIAIRTGATVAIGHDLLDFSASGVLKAPGSLTIAMSLRGARKAGATGAAATGWVEPFGIRGLTIDGLGASLGVEADGFTIGFEGMIAIGNASGKDQIVFDLGFEIVDGETPAALIASVRSAQTAVGVTLPRLIRGFTSLDLARVPLLNDVALKELSLYVVADPNGFPSPIDPTVVYRGLTVRADVILFGLEAGADIEFQYTSGLIAKGFLSKVVDLWNVVRISDYSGKKGAYLLVDTTQIVSHGSGDYLNLSGQVNLFNKVDEKIQARVNRNVFYFEMDFQVKGIADFVMKCSINGLEAFGAGASISFGLHNRTVHLKKGDIDIGTLKLDVTVQAALEIEINRQKFQFHADADFELDPSLPRLKFSFTINEAFKDLARVIEEAFQRIAELGWDLFKDAFQDVKQLLDLAKRGLITLTDDLGRVFKEVYGKTKEEAAQLLKNAGYAADRVATLLASGYKLAQQDVLVALKGAGYSVEDVSGAMNKAFHWTGAQLAQGLRSAGYTAEEAARGLKTAYNWTGEQVATALHGVGYAADETARGLKTAYNWTGDQAATALKGAGYAADQVAGGLKIAYGWTGQQVATTLHALGFGADQVAGVLKTTFHFSGDEVATVLKGVGFGADQVAGGLKSAYSWSGQQVASSLKKAGYGADQVAKGLQTAYGWSADQIGTALKDVGFGAKEIAGVFKGSFGWTADHTAKFMKDSLKFGGDTVNGALHDAGYAADDIKKAMKSAFDWFKDKLNPSHW